jgi:hypothetical protein
MVDHKLPKQKRRRRFGDLRRLDGLNILSQPQVCAKVPKPIKEILAAGGVVHLRAVHNVTIARSDRLSSVTTASESSRREVEEKHPMWTDSQSVPEDYHPSPISVMVVKPSLGICFSPVFNYA